MDGSVLIPTHGTTLSLYIIKLYRYIYIYIYGKLGGENMSRVYVSELLKKIEEQEFVPVEGRLEIISVRNDEKYNENQRRFRTHVTVEFTEKEDLEVVSYDKDDTRDEHYAEELEQWLKVQWQKDQVTSNLEKSLEQICENVNLEKLFDVSPLDQKRNILETILDSIIDLCIETDDPTDIAYVLERVVQRLCQLEKI
jgi:hypothetical protein